MPSKSPAETRFVELMAELFQLDEAEALDFGLYRVIRRHNREVREFLGEVAADKTGKTLKGGRLSVLMDEAFAFASEEEKAEDQWRIRELEEELSLKPGMSASERKERLASLESVKATAPLVREYLSRMEQKAGAAGLQNDRAEVLNRLYQFFARHYQDGDFIVERRYGQGGARYIKSTGEDTEFHWATEDMYYIKSGDIFTDYPVRLANGRSIVFSVEPESLQATRAALKPNDKAHYELDAILPSVGAGHARDTEDSRVNRAHGALLQVRLKYLKGAGSDKHKEAIVEAVHAKAGGDPADIKRWLNRYIARNQSDFFIHKRLREALAEDLDIFIKTEVLNVGQLLAEGDLPGRQLKTARLVRRIGLEIIEFLAALEDFQKALWEKKKLVFSTRYVISLDRIEKLAGADWLEARLDGIIQAQREEWQALGLGDFPDAAATRRTGQADLLSEGPRYLPLPVDTGRFDEAFKCELLEAATRETGLDEALDGVAIHSDNWQALNTMQAKYRERVKCIYIDPPYNTGGDGFPYKDAYPHASWLAMMGERLDLAQHWLRADGVIFTSIDQNEYPNLKTLMNSCFGLANALGTVVWKNVTDNNPTNIAIEHEYIECFAKNRSTLESEWKSPYSDVKDMLIRVGKDLIEKYGDTLALQAAYENWFRENKLSLGPMEGYKFIDKDGIYAGSRSVHNPGKEGYRYDIPHNKTGKPCKMPLMGYRFPEATYKKLLDDGRIIFGEDEDKIIELKVYAHEYAAKLPSVIELDGRSGANDLANLFGENQKFKNPKASALLQEIIPYAAGKTDMVMDFFSGSGTTAHAVLRLNSKREMGIRWLMVEVNPYFDTLLIARIKKAAFSTEWLKGNPSDSTGPGLFLRVQSLEQYEDTLENLGQEDEEGQMELGFDDPAFQLRYRLDRKTRRLYAGIERFASPFGYRLKRVEGGQAPSRDVDLVESLAYLLGLDIGRLYRETEGVVLTGHNRRGQSALVLFREVGALSKPDGVVGGLSKPDSSRLGNRSHDSGAVWLQAKLQLHPADKYYTNDPASLLFEGCEKFESIEEVFALQFGRE